MGRPSQRHSARGGAGGLAVKERKGRARGFLGLAHTAPCPILASSFSRMGGRPQSPDCDPKVRNRVQFPYPVVFVPGGVCFWLAVLPTVLIPVADRLSASAARLPALLAIASSNGLRHYLKVQFADQTFKGLYHWNWFDASMLLPYFAVMILLSFYGIHRYTMCYQYFKYRKNYDPNPPRHFDELPNVTIQLPIFNEQFVIDRLIEAVCAMEYPREKLEIQVLDDSTDETTEVAAGIVDRYAALGHPIVYIHRTNRHGFKAGALDAGLKVAKGEFVAIFDADFVPPPDWLMKVIHHFAEPEIGMVQTRWTHLNRDYSMLTQIEAILLDGHFVLEHGARVRSRRVLQLQRHRRHVAPPGHRRRRRLAARHAHRGHRPQLPLADGRLEVQISARRRVPLRAAHRDDRLQDPAGALGQGSHPDQHQSAAHGLPLQHPAAQQDRGRLPPHRQPELSAHGHHVGAADSRHDLPLLPGLVSDAAHRRAALYRIHASRSRSFT